MAKYLVGIREVHVNTVEVELPEGASEEEIKQAAADNSGSQSVLDEYSHSLDPDVWSVEKVPEPDVDPRPILPEQETCPKCGAGGSFMMVTSDGSPLCVVKCEDCNHEWREPDAEYDGDTLECKFCHKGIPAEGAYMHQNGWVGDCCWDERLRSTE